MVEIRVGANNQLFRVHKSFLVNKIPYFKKMFSGGFKEAKEDKATFPEDDPGAFKLLIEWVYTGNLSPLNYEVDEQGSKVVSKEGLFTHTWSPISAYNLADKLCAYSLMDRIMSAQIQRHKAKNRLCSLASFKREFSQCPEGSNIRKYLAHSLHYIIMELRGAGLARWPTEEVYKLVVNNVDLGRDLFELLRNHPPGTHVQDPRTLPLCTFHVHGADEECPDKGKFAV